MIKRKSASPGDHSRIERESRDVKRDMLTSKKVIFRNYADLAEIVSGKVVDFRKSRF